jgi:hypothetical protein
MTILVIGDTFYFNDGNGGLTTNAALFDMNNLPEGLGSFTNVTFINSPTPDQPISVMGNDQDNVT